MAELLFPGASVAATCVLCPVPEVVRGKLIHHGDVSVFVGSSYRELMDREIIQRKREKKERVKAKALHPQPAPLLGSLMHWQRRYSSFMLKTGGAGKMALSSLFG